MKPADYMSAAWLNTYALQLLIMLNMGGCGVITQSGTHLPPFNLLAPHTLGNTIEAYQQIKLSYEDTQHTLESAVHIDPQAMQIVLLNPLGLRLATILYDGNKLTIKDLSNRHRDIPAWNIPETLQMVYWPISKLQTHNDKWRITQSQRIRHFYFSDILVAQVTYETDTPWQGAIAYQNYRLNIKLNISSVLLN